MPSETRRSEVQTVLGLQVAQGSKRTQLPGRGTLDLRQFIAALLIVFLTFPYSLSPQLLAASDPAQPPAASGQRSAVSVQRPAVASKSSTISDAALSRQAPTLNGGAIEGSLRVFEGKNFDLGSKFAMTGDLFVVGTPEIELQPDATYGGTVEEGGAATPSYKIRLQKGVSFPGKIHIRTDPVPLPADIPTSVPAPVGSRKVKVNKADDVAAIGDWKTVEDLTVNADNVTIDVPPGNYGSFTTNGPSVLRFSTGDYNFAAGLSLHQKSNVVVTGPASISVGSAFTTDGGKILAAGGLKPHQLRVNLLGNTVNLNGAARLEALVRAPAAHVSISGDEALVRGQLIADRLTLNGGRIIGDVVPTDSTPPVVEVLTPTDNTTTYASKIAVHGLARDEGEITTGVQSVSVNAVAADFDPVSGNWMASVPLSLGDNLIRASAADGATPANIGTAEIHVVRQNPGPPALSLSHPADGAFLAANTVTVAGRVTSDSPEVTVSVTVNGQAATVAGNEFARSVTLVDGPNPITVVATDSLSQISQQTISVTCDLTPPRVSLVSVPSVVLPGSSYRITAEASDNYRLGSVEFSIDGQRQAELQAPPFEFTYVVPAGYAPGRRIAVSALARDASGRVGTDSGETRVSGPGGVAGRVFDDRTGYPLAEVAVASTDGGAAASAADGAWFFVSPLSVGVARFSKPGYTISERDFGLASGQGAWLLDARLTPIDAHQNNLGPDGGQASDSSGRVQATVAPGTLAAPLDLRLTPISQQGLANVLPFGWSPVPGGVVDFRPVTPPQGFADILPSPARLVVSSLPDALGALTPALVFYDDLSHRWNVVQAHVTAAANGSLAADLARFGQYAFVVPDAGVTAPPAPVEGQTLASGPAASHALLDSATAFATASPAVALYSPEAQSTIRMTADPAAKIPSGIWCEASFDERYDLRGQSEPKLVERARQTFVLYSYPAATSSELNRLSASFTAKPTVLDFPLAEFRAANLHVGISSAEPELGRLADATGATIKSAGGVELELPAGALGAATPVFLETLSAEEISLLLPEGFDVVGGALVDLSGATLASSARLAMPAFMPETTRLVVARIITAGDRRGPKLVARAVEVNGQLQSTIYPPAVPPGLTLPGITEGGVYAFIRLPGPFGYASGTVTRAAVLAPGVRVTVDTNPFVDVTSTAGRYLLPGIAGTDFQGLNNLSAASLASDETGNATVTLAAQDALTETPIAVASVPLAIASVTPASGATGVPVSTPVRVTFTKPVRPASVTSSSFKLTTPSGNPVAGSLAMLVGNQAATFTPQANLAPGVSYRISLSTAVLDLYGNPLPAAFSSTFTTAAIQPVSGRLMASQISISYPDELGFVTIRIAAGVIPAGCTVVALNETMGSTTTVSVGAGPVEIRLLARVGDDIRIIVRQPSGVDYEVSQSAYRSADGFTAVGPKGGTVVSDEGTIALVIEPGAINGLAEIRVIPAPESSIPIPREPGTPMDPANVLFGAGLRIESRGNFTVEKELHVEVAAPPGVAEGVRAICLSPAKAIDPDTGEEVDVWDSVTSAVVQNGRFKTTSLPFAGLVGLSGVSIYMFMPRFSHTMWGWVKEATKCYTDAPEDAPPYLPVAGVLCVSPAAGPMLRGQVTARSGPDGRYAMFDVTMAAPTNIVLFIDEVKQRRVASGTNFAGFMPQDNELIQFLSGMQGFTYGNVDGLLPCPPYYDRSSAPVLLITGKQINLEEGQEDALPVRGVARVGATVEVTVTADRPLALIEGRVLVGGASPEPLNWRIADDECVNRCQYITVLEAAAEGGYRVEVRGYSGSAPPAETSYLFVALRNPNIKESIGGAPFVNSCVPKDKTEQVDINTDIQVEFSEPVKNLVGGTTVFLEEGPNSRIGGTVLSGGIPVGPDQLVSSIVFKPERPLLGGRSYTFHVTQDVVDTNDAKLQNNADASGPGEFTSRFSTFAGKVLYSQVPSEDSIGLRIAVDGRYSFVLELATVFSSKLVTYDAVDPRTPKFLSEFTVPQMAIDLAVSSETKYWVDTGFVRRIGVITGFYPFSQDRAANVWIVALDDPVAPFLIGVSSLYFPEGLTAVPLAVKIHDGRAYVGNAPYRGLFVVDIQKAISLWAGHIADEHWKGPRYLAVSPFEGFGQAAIAQSLLYSDNPAVPTMANSISVITQDVSGEELPITGLMPVLFAVNPSRKSFVAAGFPRSLDGTFGHMPGGQFGDLRILAEVDLDPAYPTSIHAISQAAVGNEFKDLVVILTDLDLRIYDASHYPIEASPLSMVPLAALGVDVEKRSTRLIVEDGLAYISSFATLSVIDISRPTDPRLVTTLSGEWFAATSLAVQDAFIHSIRPQGYYNIGIARPVAQVFVHGLAPTVPVSEEGSGLLCSNPVIIDRNNPAHPMIHPAEVLFQIFGMSTEMEQGQVIIRKGEATLESIPVKVRQSDDDDVITGAVTWKAPNTTPIDITASYTAQVVLGDFKTEPEPIPMSYLLPEYQTTIQVLADQGPLGEGGKARPYTYVLGANAGVTITVNGKEKVNAFRTFGLNSEKLDLSDLEVGRYELRLRAELPGSDAYGEEMVGVLEVAANPNDVRVPNHTIVGGIDLGTGQLGLTYTDLMIKGRGLSLEFTRSYNQATANVFGPLGYGWHHNYQMLLVHNKEDRLYTIIGGDAQGETFVEEVGGVTGGPAPPTMAKGVRPGLRSLSPFHTTLVANSDGSFDYHDKANLRYHFPGALERDSYSYYRQAYMGNLEYIADSYKSTNKIELSYDALGRLATVCDPSDRCLTLRYEEALAPFVGVVVPNLSGHSSETCVDAEHFPLIRDHFAKSDAGKAWRIQKIEGPGGLAVIYEYDEYGNLKLVNRGGAAYAQERNRPEDPGPDTPGIDSQATADYIWQYFYKPQADAAPPPGQDGNLESVNLNHLLWRIVSPNVSPNEGATEYQFQQDNAGLPVRAVHYPEGVSNYFSYSFDSQNPVKIRSLDVTDGRNIKTHYELEKEKVRSIQVGAAVTEFQYNHEQGLKTWERDPLGMIRTYEHDLNGNVAKLTQTEPGESATIVTTATFDVVFNRPLLRVDANAKPTNFQLNEGGDVKHVRFADGSWMELVYDDSGQLTKVTDRLGLMTEYKAYDDFGNPVEIVQETAPGKTTTTRNEWDVLSRLVSTSSTLGPTISYKYDKQDRVYESVTTDPTGIRAPLTLTYAYKPGGQVIRETKVTNDDAQAQIHEIIYEYDNLERRTGITDKFTERGLAEGTQNLKTTSYHREFAYDANSNLVWETNRRGIGSAYTYTDQNFLDRHEIHEKQPDGTWAERLEADPEPDLVGNPKTVTDRYGTTTSLEYDGLHRLTGRIVGPYAERWTLDDNGNITEFTDRQGRKTIFEYEDGLNRVTLRKDPIGRETRWTYDLLDIKRSVTTMTQHYRGLMVVTERDGLDRPLKETITCASCTGSPYETSWTYIDTDLERKVVITDPRGKQTSRFLSRFCITAGAGAYLEACSGRFPSSGGHWPV